MGGRFWYNARMDYNNRHNERDRLARDRMDELIAGSANRAIQVMSTLVEGEA